MRRNWTTQNSGRKLYTATAIAAVSLMLPGLALGAEPAEQGAQSRELTNLERSLQKEINTVTYISVFDHLAFQVNDAGEVILSGDVTRASIKSGAEAAAMRVEGVTSVQNNIELLPPSTTDDRIRVAAANAIFGSVQPTQISPRPALHIIVENGRITLKGQVNTELDKTLAYFRTVNIPGVISVTNELEVASS